MAPAVPVGRRALLAGLAALPLVPATALARLPDRRRPYAGPNVVIVRFGGGVRRAETIDPATSHAPFFLHRMIPEGTLFRSMVMGSDNPDAVSGHGHGTLYISTGVYHPYTDIQNQQILGRFEPAAPTIFEYLRQKYDLAPHEALILNGEDRAAEDFFNYSNHHLFGVHYRSEVLSLLRFKTWLMEQHLAEGAVREPEALSQRLQQARALDFRAQGQGLTGSPRIQQFWQTWRETYGDSGLRHARGDRALTQMGLAALEQLQPRLMMIHYQDPDYVHWGRAHHYTQGIRVIDEGLQALMSALDRLPAYRGNTVVIVVPDCGRDSNPLMPIPYQHHFRTRSAGEIFALVMGPGVARGRVVDRPVEQTAIAPTVGALMGFEVTQSPEPVLEEALL